MSQEKNKIDLDNTYEVVVSYHVVDIDDKGKLKEVKKSNQKIQFYKLQRRNMAHSRFATKVLEGTTDPMDMALNFVDICLVDESIKTDLMGDALACLEIYRSEIVGEDFRRFFEGWEYYQNLLLKLSQKN
jgi:hypothetical protein